MWNEMVQQIFLALCGFASGLAISAGVFALIITLGVIPRLAGKTHTSSYVITYENMIFLGGMCGNLLTVFQPVTPAMAVWLQTLLLAVTGLMIGAFTGCMAVALTEILNTFPILFRRLKLKRGQNFLLCAMALGKMAGSLFFFKYMI